MILLTGWKRKGKRDNGPGAAQEADAEYPICHCMNTKEAKANMRVLFEVVVK